MSISAAVLVKGTYLVVDLRYRLAECAYGHLLKVVFRVGDTFTEAIRLGGMGGSYGRPLPSPSPSAGGAGTSPMSAASTCASCSARPVPPVRGVAAIVKYDKKGKGLVSGMRKGLFYYMAVVELYDVH